MENATDIHDREKIECLLDNIHQIQRINICVISLSQKRDLLSQWRAYSGGIGGFSIGFKSSNLIDRATQQGFYLVKCVYEEDTQHQIMSELVDECLAEDFNTEKTRVDPNRPRTIFALRTGGEFSSRLAAIAPVIKHQSFSEEDEWRLISEKGFNVSTLAFRSGVSTLTPYLSLDWVTNQSIWEVLR